jgi:hypothetical protein
MNPPFLERKHRKTPWAQTQSTILTGFLWECQTKLGVHVDLPLSQFKSRSFNALEAQSDSK